MALLDKMKDTLTTAGQEVSQKAKNTAESIRINNLIKSNDKMIEKLTYQVGNKCVEQHVNETGTEYDEFFQEIIRLRKENEAYQEELKKLEETNTCGQCGFNNNASAKFCINCGAKLADQPEQKEKPGKVCGKCGFVNESDAFFCTECGTNLRAAQDTQETNEAAECPEVEAVEDEVEVVVGEVEFSAEEKTEI